MLIMLIMLIMNIETNHRYVLNFNQEVIMPYIGLILLLINIAYYIYNSIL